MNEQIILSIETNLTRLRRAYDLSSKHADLASLWDLAHALRVIMDSKNSFQEYIRLRLFSVRFLSYSPTRQLIKDIRNREYIITALPNGATSYALAQRISLTVPYAKMTSIVGAIPSEKSKRRLAPGGMTYTHALFLPLDKEPKYSVFNFTKSSFLTWLDQESVRASYFNQDDNVVTHTISREQLIRRVCNAFGPSHPVSNEFDSQDWPEHTYDQTVKKIMKFKVSGLPVPYFILLNIAEEILYNFNRL